jgi:hypothetical protein
MLVQDICSTKYADGLATLTTVKFFQHFEEVSLMAAGGIACAVVDLAGFRSRILPGFGNIRALKLHYTSVSDQERQDVGGWVRGDRRNGQGASTHPVRV